MSKKNLPTKASSGVTTKSVAAAGAKKHRKVLRDNIQGITKPAIQRMAYKGGVKSMSGLIYEEIRGIMSVHLNKVMSASITYMENDRRKTVKDVDVISALKFLGRTPAFNNGKEVLRSISTAKGTIKRTVKEHNKSRTNGCHRYQGRNRGLGHHVGGALEDIDGKHDIDDEDKNEDDYVPDDENLGNEKDYADDTEADYDDDDDDSNPYADSSDFGKDDGSIDQLGGANKSAKATGGVKKPHRFHPGTVALRKIRYYQKSGNCFLMAKLPFERFVREIAQDYKNDVRFSVDAIMIMQLDIEDYIVDLFTSAQEVALHAKHIRVTPSDIQIARKMSHGH